MTNRAAALLLQIGVIAVVVVALPYRLFELDRYFVPKELVLHVVALLVAATMVWRRRTINVDMADALLALFLVWSVLSALFATNYWLAQRALGVSVSSAIIFWAARRVGGFGWHRGILVACALATVLAVATSLAQAYGVDTEYFSTNRAPGGTFGNRNFVAHVAAIGLPAIVWCTVTARRAIGALLGSISVGLVAAALVLSRSRGAWLAVAVSLIVLAGPVLVSRKYWVGGQVGGRFARQLLGAFIGATLAIILPNRLNWNSDSPYLDSARAVVDYSKGSGRGRVAQYRNSLRMAESNPLFGVGPGNWPVRYVKFAPRSDRSIADDGMTANPWPSSDWVAYLSERGLIAALALLGAFASLFFGAFRGWAELADGDAVLAKLALAGTVAAVIVVSAFDVALLLAAPAFLLWTIIGATAGSRRHVRPFNFSRRSWAVIAGGVMLILVASTARSAAQTVAMTSVGRGGHTAGWVRGAAWDPGSYRINMKVAELYSRRGRCGMARGYLRQALSLFPDSPPARRLSRKCG